jgi:hypothetical protein
LNSNNGFDEGEMQDLYTFTEGDHGEFKRSVANSANSRDQVVGNTWNGLDWGQGAEGEYRAFLWENGKMYLLQERVSNFQGWRTLDIARSINAAGQIVGWGTADKVVGNRYLTHAYLLTPEAP